MVDGIRRTINGYEAGTDAASEHVIVPLSGSETFNVCNKVSSVSSSLTVPDAGKLIICGG